MGQGDEFKLTAIVSIWFPRTGLAHLHAFSRPLAVTLVAQGACYNGLRTVMTKIEREIEVGCGPGPGPAHPPFQFNFRRPIDPKFDVISQQLPCPRGSCRSLTMLI